MTKKKPLYSLTFSQREIWFDQMLNSEMPLYNIGGYVKVDGQIDVRKFRLAVNLLVQKHDALRLIFEEGKDENGLPMQYFLPELSVFVPLIDFSSEVDPHMAALAWMQQRLVEPYELYGKPLFRYDLLKIEENQYYWLMQYHHLISDGWSVALINRSLAEIYTAICQNDMPNLFAPSYCDYFEKEHNYISSDQFKIDCDYWTKQYQTIPDPLLQSHYQGNFPKHSAIPSQCHTIYLSYLTYAGLNKLAKHTNVSTFHVILGVLYTYFTRTSQQDELVIGLPILNRSNATFRNTAGLFVGVSSVNFSFDNKSTFRLLIQNISRELKQHYRHQRLPISKINQIAGVDSEAGNSQLFDLSINYAKQSHNVSFDKGHGRTITLSNCAEQTPLTISIWEFNEAEDVQIDFSYNLAYFNQAEIRAIAARFVNVLENVLDDPEKCLGDIPLLTKLEAEELIDWNKTFTNFPKNYCIHELFEKQVEKNPDAVALVFEEQLLSYSELDTRANQLAYYLVNEKQVKPGTLVGVCLNRSMEMVIAILGILKAGGAYVPLDPDYPRARLAYMLDDAALDTVITSRQQYEKIPITELHAVCLDDEMVQQKLSSQAKTNFNKESFSLNSNYLAYVIYTSGSTGQPKGVMVEHQNVTSLVINAGYVPLSKDTIMLQNASIAFDAATFELWGALLNGGTLVIQPDSLLEMGALGDFIIKNDINTAWMTAGLFDQFSLIYQTPLTQLEYLLVGGDVVSQKSVQQIKNNNPYLKIINGYGPTENTTFSCCYLIPDSNNSKSLPIGKPIANRQAYVLDKEQMLTPIGIIGELYVGGFGIARGYLNRPELTQEKFISNPFSDDSNERLYKTGDLVRWLSDGNLEFIGRIDDQIKIRGFRIELGEIESTLLAHNDVNEAVVVAYGNEASDKYLVAYVVADTNAINDWREYLTQSLPQYMVPLVFMVLDTLPLTSNGKVDRKGLPAPDISQLQAEYIEPTTDTEKVLCDIWRAVLNVERVGITDNFFRLGGHSLLLIQLLTYLRKKGFHTNVQTLFSVKTLGELAEKLGKNINKEGGDISFVVPLNLISESCDQLTPEMLPLIDLTQAAIDCIVETVPGGAKNIQDIYPLAPLQEGILFHHRMSESGGDPYIVSGLLLIEGENQKNQFINALQLVIDRHDVLRTAILWKNLPQAVQVVYRHAPLPVSEIELDTTIDVEHQLKIRMEPSNSTWDITQAPLMRLQIARVPQSERHYIILQFHHITCDHVGLEIIQSEIKAVLKDQLVSLPEPRPYREFVAHVLHQAETLDAETFFRNKLGTVIEPTAPFGLLDIHSGTNAIESEGILPFELSNRIRLASQNLGISPAVLFHAAYALMISRCSLSDDVVFGSVFSGRLQGMHDVENVLGMFINTLPIRLTLHNMTVKQVLLQVQMELAELLPYEQASLAIAQQCSELPSDVPLFSSIFNYRHSVTSYENTALSEGIKFLSGQERTNYPFTVSVDDFGEDFGITAQVDAAIDPACIVDYLQVAVEGLVDALDIEPEKNFLDIGILPQAEKQQQLIDWNDTKVEYPSDRCMHHLFEQQVKQTPDAIALSFEDQVLTYAELNSRSNQLAHYLIQQKHIEPDTLVGVCLERSLEMMVAILGILKAGGAYVPLDPDYPQARLTYMLEDAALATVLTCHDVLSRTPVTESQAVCLDDEWIQQQLLSQDASNLTVNALTPEHLAYVIYTSGSTGQPKGVQIEHKSFTNYLCWALDYYQVAQLDGSVVSSSLNFDATITSLYLPLLSGKTVILSPEHKEIDTLIEQLLLGDRLLFKITPSHLQMLIQIESIRDHVLNDKSHTFVVGGEELSSSLKNNWLDIFPNSRLINEYGPTESVVGCCIYELKPQITYSLDKKVPIGCPIDNTHLHILDQHLKLVPQGVVGELHIGGVGLARGYLNRDDLTQEKFIRNPFNNNIEDRLYKTGDLVRWLPDGNLEYVGRIDDQVKIRGFRIELGEIENTLLTHQDIKEVVVIAREDDGDNRLVAYVVAQTEAIEHWRDHINQTLPEYMVPSMFVVLDVMPLTSNGKIDRRALPAPDLSQLQDDYVAPTTETEKILCEIWQNVLGIEQVGIADNFFQLGGHSLLATRMIAQVNSRLNVELPLKTLFEFNIIKALAVATNQLETKIAYPAIESISHETPLLLSYAQRRLWFIDQLEGGSQQYNMSASLQLIGLVNIDALQFTFNTIIKRHESLRTVFVSEGEEPQQIIQPISNFNLPVIDLSDLTDIEQTKNIQRYTKEIANKHFELDHDLMLRAQLLKLSDNEHILSVAMHHIASDGWSVNILIKELSVLYQSYLEGREAPLQPLAIQYADYAHWQHEWLQGEILTKQIDYWQKQLSDLPVVHSLPLDYTRPSQQTFIGANIRTQLSQATFNRLQDLCDQQGITLFMGLHAVFSVLLARYSGETDIIMGSPIANREQVEVADLIGFFVNTLVLRSDLSGNPSFIDVLQQSKQTALDAYAHQQVPFEQLVEVLQPERSLNHSPLFQIMLVLQNNAQSTLELPGLTLNPMAPTDIQAKFDLSLTAEEMDKGLHLNWVYNIDLFNAGTIERMSAHFNHLLEQLLMKPTASIHSIELLNEIERDQQLIDWNDTKVEYPSNHCIHHLFEQQVKQTPDAIALTFEDQALTYAELNSRSNQLAHYLINQKHIKPDTLVGVCLERSLEMMVAILGILKAGGAYVPLDPDYPQARLTYMLEDAALATVLTCHDVLSCTPVTESQAVCLDDEFIQQQLLSQDASDLTVNALTPAHLAYIIYTSGSTGQPKGVQIEHKNFTNYLCWALDYYQVAQLDGSVVSSSLNFDATITSLYLPLLSGKTVILSPEHKEIDTLIEQLLLGDRLLFKITPSHLQMLIQIESIRDHVLNDKSHTFVVGGEELSSSLKNNWLDIFPNSLLINQYGPTEATVACSAYNVKPRVGGALDKKVSIGCPIDNTHLHILDQHLKLVPQGVIGELHIGGVGLARGYLNRDDLTQEKFIQNPFDDDPNARLYKTGDLVRWLPDGNLEFMGRIDDQVKIRGFRIELGEIENTLLTHQDINEAVVVVREKDDDKYLVVYVVADTNAINNWREHLSQILPEYMMPSIFMVLDSMPLTPNGKIDRRALPTPDINQLQNEYVAPTTETEKILCEIWQDVLGIEQVGITDNFFQLGGHSLLLVKLLARLRAVGRKTDIRSLFGTPILGELAALLDREVKTHNSIFSAPPNVIPDDCDRLTPEMLPLIDLTQAAIDQIVETVPGGVKNIQDIYPLAPLQEGILFHHQMSKDDGDLYVMPILLKASTIRQRDEFINALKLIINRHDALRTAVLWEGLPQAVQVVCRHVDLPVDKMAIDSTEDVMSQLMAKMAPAKQSMDITQAPLLRIQTADDLSSSQYFILLQLHHIISDHVGLEIIQAEINAILQDQKESLITPAPYREFVAHALYQAKTLDAETFFRDKLGTVTEPTAPFGLLDVHGDGSDIAEAKQTLPSTLSNKIRSLSKQLAVSPAALFHVGFGLVVGKCSGRSDVVFGTVLSGRLQGTANADRMLGMFINTLPFRLNLQGINVEAAVGQAQTELMALLPYEQTSLALAQQCSGLPSGTPLFSAMLNYRHSAPEEYEVVAGSGIELLSSQERTNYPFTVSVDDFGEDLGITAQVDAAIDPACIVDYLQVAVEGLVNALDTEPEKNFLDIDILSQAEKQQQLIDWNDTRTEYPSDHCIHHLFEQQVKRTPDAIALSFEDQTLTYAELNSRSNQLAHYLIQQKHIEPDTLVGVCLERSLEMMVAILGILKAGGAYVPLDPDYPQARLTYMLEDAALATVLTCHDVLSRTPVTESQAVCLDDEWIQQQLLSQDASNLTVNALTPEHLAYVIYTSGSTGQPKGVQIEHKSFTNYLCWALDYYQVAQLDGSVVSSSLNFDATITSLYLPLLSGKTVILSPEHKEIDTLIEQLLLGDRLLFKITPSHLQMLIQIESIRDHVLNDKSHTFVVGGEELSSSLKNNWLDIFPNSRLINEYGPTESVVGCCIYELKPQITHSLDKKVPIGCPIDNTRLHVLDQHLKLVPQGVIGELHIGGVGLARGYLNRDDLTQEKFIQNPFNNNFEDRLYKTGDLVRWLLDGNLEYVGRIDDQVKIRGFRIELGEIENTLLTHQDIKEVVVIAREDDGDNRLVAYVVTETDAIEHWRDYLSQSLPEYMVPSMFVVLDVMPLTSNGKIDRRALPAPDLSQLQDDYVAPTTETEKILCEIWQDVLGIEQVGVADNFFQLGGHSLLLIQVLSRLQTSDRKTNIRSLFGTPILGELAALLDREANTHNSIFSAPPNIIPDDCDRLTSEMLPLIDLTQVAIDQIVETVPGGAKNIQDIYPLAPLQEGILFHHQMSEWSGNPYVSPVLLVTKTDYKRNEFLCALQSIINRHDVLRTAILWEGLPQAVQVVCRHVDLPVDKMAIDSTEDVMSQLMAKMAPAKQSMDITQAPLLRIQTADDLSSSQYFILLQLHHIISDHVGLEIIQAEINAILQDQVALLTKPAPYREFVAHALHQAKTLDAETFFRDKFGNVTEPTAPFGLLDVHGDGSDIVEAKQTLPSTLSNKIRSLSKQLAVSPAALFHVGFGLVVGKCSGRSDVIFGTVLSGRLQGTANADRMLGMFINTLPFRLNLQGINVEAAVGQAQAELMALLPYEQTSLALAQQCSGLPSGTPLFSAMLNYRHSVANAHESMIESGIESLGGYERTNYPFNIAIDDLVNDFAITAQINIAVDPIKVIDYLQTAMAGLVNALETEKEKIIPHINILTEAELHQQLIEWNGTTIDYPQDQCIHEIFEQHVQNTPGAIALTFNDQQLTYNELNIKANQLAHYLINEKQIKPNTLVGICLDRSLEMIISILGILKAGGAYVPLDPKYPKARLAYMLDDASLKTVITNQDILEQTPITPDQGLCLDHEAVTQQLSSQLVSNIAPETINLVSSHIAYVIYTSGSTGHPKGVLVSHQNLQASTHARREYYDSTNISFLLLSSISFDSSVAGIFWTLSSGGKLCLPTEIAPDELEKVIIDQKVTHLLSLPSLYRELLNAWSTETLHILKSVIVGGEQSSHDIIKIHKQKNNASLLFNEYGPTEGTVWSTVKQLDSIQDSQIISIGKPISNVQLYILDEQAQLVPVGVVGELYIAGAGVARGYLNQPDLTQEKFIQNPLSDDPNDRLYKTGDLVRWLPDGNLEFIGRVDDQVKIRGFRVELGEIEYALLNQNDIDEVVVIARSEESGNNRLVAYVVADNEAIDRWREHLSQTLPYYMVPSAFVVLDVMPLMPNGKINRHALPAPGINQLQDNYVAPTTETEKILCEIWQDVLGVERVGITDNFFQLGGHSLSMTKAAVSIRQKLSLEVPLKTLFEMQNIQLLAASLKIFGLSYADELAEESEMESFEL